MRQLSRDRPNSQSLLSPRRAPIIKEYGIRCRTNERVDEEPIIEGQPSDRNGRLAAGRNRGTLDACEKQFIFPEIKSHALPQYCKQDEEGLVAGCLRTRAALSGREGYSAATVRSQKSWSRGDFASFSVHWGHRFHSASLPSWLAVLEVRSQLTFILIG
jgi:hypothetical protein